MVKAYVATKGDDLMKMTLAQMRKKAGFTQKGSCR